MRVLARRRATVHGELDLVTLDGDVVCACEVKCSLSRFPVELGERRYRPGCRVDRERLARLERAAQALGRAARRPARVDLVEVLISGHERRLEIAWHRDYRTPLARLARGVREASGPGRAATEK